MINTKLPNKTEWGKQLDYVRATMGIDKVTLAKQSAMSRPTLDKAIKGEGTHDQLKNIEGALRAIIREKV